MKKNYFMVLIALMAFALNANAQDATGQDETNNRMTVKMNDGTSFILNTDNVAEITFGDGEPAFSAQNIIKALEALDELGQYVNRLEALEANDAMLMTFAEDLKAIEYDTRCRVDKNQCEIDVLKADTDDLRTMLYALEVRSATQDDQIAELQRENVMQNSKIQEAYVRSSENAAEIAELEARNAVIETELMAQRERSDLQLQQIYEQRTMIDVLNNMVNQLQMEIEVLKAKVDSMQQ